MIKIPLVVVLSKKSFLYHHCIVNFITKRLSCSKSLILRMDSAFSAAYDRISTVNVFGVKDGDVAFFMRHKTNAEGFDKAVMSVYKNTDVFHVGLICCQGSSLVQATPNNGVTVEDIDTAIKQTNADYVEVCSVNQSDEDGGKVAKWAINQVGCKYNDIFSPECRDSNGATAFYCSQLVVEAYKRCTDIRLCADYKLNFCDISGNYLRQWVEYFRKKNVKIPQGEPGSHPGCLLESLTSQLRIKIHSRMAKLFLNREVNAALHFLGGCRINPKTSRTFDVYQPRND